MQSTVNIDNWTLSGHPVNRVQETKTTSASSTDTPLSYRSREEEGKGEGRGVQNTSCKRGAAVVYN